MGFPVSRDLYKSVNNLIIFFHDLMNKWQQVVLQLDFVQNWNSGTKISRNMMLSSSFWHIFVGHVTLFFLHHFILTINMKVLVSFIVRNNFVVCYASLQGSTKRSDRFETIKLYREYDFLEKNWICKMPCSHEFMEV